MNEKYSTKLNKAQKQNFLWKISAIRHVLIHSYIFCGRTKLLPDTIGTINKLVTDSWIAKSLNSQQNPVLCS